MIMCENNDAFYNLAERIEDAFMEIDSDVCGDLRKTDSEYAALRRERGDLEKDFLAITQMLEGEGDISLSAEEHAALVRYIDLSRRIEDRERRQIYFRGHTDGYAYLKRIGVI